MSKETIFENSELEDKATKIILAKKKKYGEKKLEKIDKILADKMLDLIAAQRLSIWKSRGEYDQKIRITIDVSDICDLDQYRRLQLGVPKESDDLYSFENTKRHLRNYIKDTKKFEKSLQSNQQS